jgi:hypothetical protein
MATRVGTVAIGIAGVTGILLAGTPAFANTLYPASVPGCSGAMEDEFTGGHDYVRGEVHSTTGADCSLVLHQSNGQNWGPITTTLPVDDHTAWHSDSGITSFVTVCNEDIGRCANSQSY